MELKQVMKKYHSIRKLYKYSRFYGLSNGLNIRRAFANSVGDVCKVKLSFLPYPVNLRINSTDFEAFEQIFLERDYDIKLPVEPGCIIDSGANIGLASVFYANCYPKAEIIAIEPEKSNFKILKMNTEGYSNIKCINKALWGRKTLLEVKDISSGEWGFITCETDSSTSNSIEATTLAELRDEMGISRIGLLKLDAEGAEESIFSSDDLSWLTNTDMIIADLHDQLKQGCSKPFFSAMDRFGFKYRRVGEHYFCSSL